MEYVHNGLKYSFSYQELKELYQAALQMTDEEFLADIPRLLHLAVFICNIKGVPAEQCLSDDGIVHELVHLLIDPSMIEKPLADVREVFKNTLELA